jgi:SAM-dependent methyltransferase
LEWKADYIACTQCSASFPFVQGVPVLLKRDGLFSADTAQDNRSNGFTPRIVRMMSRYVPGLTFTAYAARAKFRAMRSSGGKERSCLVVGAGDNVAENARLREHFTTVVASDVSVNRAVNVVCDGHELPFADDQFDFAILTAVLEHVLDPEQVVHEVSRVLRPGGVVYAVTPFMQQVHMGAFDFGRFTDLGHRWLFRQFEEIERGSCGGPATSLLWSMAYFAAAFGPNRICSRALALGVRLLFFWVKYLDVFLERRAASRDGANGFYFVGRNMKRPCLEPRDLIASYIGHVR